MILAGTTIKMSSTIPATKPNKKYTGGVRPPPDVLVSLDFTGQPIAAVDDKMAEGCVVGQGNVPGSKGRVTVGGKIAHKNIFNLLVPMEMTGAA